MPEHPILPENHSSQPTKQTRAGVLIVASFADSILIFRGDLIKELIKQGYPVTVSAPLISQAISQGIRNIGADVVSVPLTSTGLNPFSDLNYFWHLSKLMRRLQPVYVLTYTSKPNIWGTLAARKNGIPTATMITGLGYAFIGNGTLKQKLLGAAVVQLYRLALKGSQALLFQNRDDLEELSNRKCFPDQSKAHIINGSGVNTEHYNQVPLPEKPVFLLIARLVLSKGLREFVEASKIVMKKIPGSRFQIVGYLYPGPDGITQQDLDSWVSQGIEYLGSAEDIRPAIANCSIYVLPSYREGTPRSVLEAMSMGRPVITTDAPGCRETVRDGVNGFLVPIKDVPRLVDAMVKLASDKALREQFGHRGRSIALEKYDVALVNRQILQHTGLGNQHNQQQLSPNS